MDENKDTIENTGMESEMAQNPVEETVVEETPTEETVIEETPAEVVEVEEEEPADTKNDARGFADLGVEPRLLKAIEEMGFVNPMPNQEMVIPPLLE